MNAARVHAMLAAFLAEPARFERWSSDQGLLDGVLAHSGIDPAEVDATGIGKFAGFITKVRHNPLRHSLPLTFRALAAVGLEIEVFSGYVTRFAQLREAGSLSIEEKTSELVRFLRARLDPADAEHALVLDVLRHELAMEASPPQQQPLESTDAPEPAEAAVADAVPLIHGSLRIERMSCDPRAAADRLADPEPRLQDLDRTPRIFGYWLPPEARTVEVFELDAAGAYILSLVDGRRPLRDIACSLGEIGDGDVTPEDLLAALAGPSEIGLIGFAGRRG